MMRVGEFEITAPVLGYFRLDGGAMFGVVPKTLWSSRVKADAENRVTLVTRSLLIRTAGRTLLVDTGFGGKWPEKQKLIYDIRPAPRDEWGFADEEITDIILTHLHFDHAGGISRESALNKDTLELCFPEAQVYLQRRNWERAHQPSLRERASYIRENVAVLEQIKLRLVDGECEILPGIRVHPSDGHTRGLQWVEVRGGGRTVAYPSDLVPSAQHLALPYHTGYDMHIERLLEEKEALLAKAAAEEWILVFIHDAEVPAATVTRDEKGHYCVKEVVTL